MAESPISASGHVTVIIRKEEKNSQQRGAVGAVQEMDANCPRGVLDMEAGTREAKFAAESANATNLDACCTIS